MSLALDLPQDVHAVVVTKGTRHLVVVHRQMILLDSPEFRKSCWIDDLENSSVAALPRDVIAVALLMIVQQLLKEVPQKSAVWKEPKFSI
jgi:hypothetical protein